MVKPTEKSVTPAQFAKAYSSWQSADNAAFEKRDNFAQLVRQAYLDGNLEPLLNDVARKIPKGEEKSLRRLVREQTSDADGKNPEYSIGQAPKLDGEFVGYELKRNKAQSAPKGSSVKTLVSLVDKLMGKLENVKTDLDHSARIAEIAALLASTQEKLAEITALESGNYEDLLDEQNVGGRRDNVPLDGPMFRDVPLVDSEIHARQ